MLINNFFSPEGGAELSSLLTYRLLKENGHKVAFFATDKPPYFEPDYEHADLFPKDVDFDRLKSPMEMLKALPRLFYNAEAERRMERLLARFKPDVAHCNNLHYHLTPAVLNACRRAGVPVVMTLRDVRLMCPAGTLMRGGRYDGVYGAEYCKEELCVGGSALNCVKHRCYGGNLAKSALVAAEFYARRLHRLYDVVDLFIAPSRAIRDLAIRAGIVPEKLTVIHNFIDDNFFHRAPRQEPGRYFLFVGRLAREKGVDVLIEAMRRLPRDIQLHIVGVGPDEEVLRRQAADLENIRFAGFLQGKALQEQYRDCLASVVPSNWFENFSRTVIESVASGKAVIGSRVGGIEEVVEHEETGLLVEPGDIDQLADALARLHAHPALAVELGCNARRKAEQCYNARHFLARTLESYYDAMERHRRACPSDGVSRESFEMTGVGGIS